MSTNDEAPVARTESGLVAGKRQGAVRAFLGLPYAAPPLGDLRWRAPQPVQPWSGVRAAQAFSPIALQPPRSADSVYAEYSGEQPMSEDCLYLNVWSAAEAGAKLPVMVWFHGGAFQQGAGSNPVFVQGNLAEQGVVLVTFNYRLGPLGFLPHPELAGDDGASGNCGLLDMAAALRWVQRNIAAFGGDPDQVTIFGQSAGADGVLSMMASPATAGLFQRAAAHSFGFKPRPGRAEAEATGLEFMHRAGARSLAELRRMGGAALVAAAGAQGLRFMPIVDGAFNPRQIAETFELGEQQRVPFITGWNRDEGSTFPAAATAADFRAALEQRFGAAALEQALALYPAGSDDEARRSSLELTGDGLFAWGCWRAARAHTRFAPTWLYHFEHLQPFAPGQGYREARPARDLGVFHSSEYPFVFGSTGVLTRQWGEADARVTRLMQALWLSFAKTGAPAAAGVSWPTFDDGRDTVLNLSDSPRLGGVPRRGHLQFVDR